MADEGVCKSKRNKLMKVDIIFEDKKLIEIYVAIVKEMAIKYDACVAWGREIISYINDIYEGVIQTAEYTKCARDAKIDAEGKKLTEVLITLLYALDKELGSVAENTCLSCAAASEKFGMAMGFRYALMLMRGCDIWIA